MRAYRRRVALIGHGTTIANPFKAKNVFNLMEQSLRRNLSDEDDPQQSFSDEEGTLTQLDIVNARPSFENILADTLFTRKELRAIYRAFKEAAPFSRDTFRSSFATLFPHGDIEHYADLVFETFEPNDRGYIDFHKFIKIFSALSRGPLNEKLEWIYKLYDPMDVGKIDWERLFYVITATNDLLGTGAKPIITQQIKSEHADHILEKFDKVKKGYITKEDFMERCSEDEEILNSISSLCSSRSTFV